MKLSLFSREEEHIAVRPQILSLSAYLHRYLKHLREPVILDYPSLRILFQQKMLSRRVNLTKLHYIERIITYYINYYYYYKKYTLAISLIYRMFSITLIRKLKQWNNWKLILLLLRYRIYFMRLKVSGRVSSQGGGACVCWQRLHQWVYQERCYCCL